jgi:hypothetical protein
MSRKKFIIIFNTWAIFRGSKVHRFTGSKVQGSEVHRFKGSGFRGSRVQRFTGSGFRGSSSPLATGRWALVSGLW